MGKLELETKVKELYLESELSQRDVATKLGIPYGQVVYIVGDKLQVSRTRSKAHQIAARRYHLPTPGRELSSAHRQKIGIGLTGRPVSKTTRGKIASSLNGHSVSSKTRNRISTVQKEQFRTGRRLPNTHTLSAGWFKTSTGINVRSSWELFVCNLLTQFGIKWQYEPQVFDLGFASYRPDLYIPEYKMWIEIKGYWWNGERTKVDTFCKTHPLLLIDENKYRQLIKDNRKIVGWLVAMQ